MSELPIIKKPAHCLMNKSMDWFLYYERVNDVDVETVSYNIQLFQPRCKWFYIDKTLIS